MKTWILLWAFFQAACWGWFIPSAYGGMMGDLPKAQPAVYYADNQTFSVWSEKEKLSLFLGVKNVTFGTKDGCAAVSFTDQGMHKSLLLRPGEGVIISADSMFPGGPKLPQAPSQPRVGPRK